MKHRHTLRASLCLNLALAVLLWSRFKSPIVPASERVPSLPSAAVVPVAAMAGSGHISLAPTTWVTNRFHWSKIEADDFVQLAANLRAIVCPEKTVRDIVVARGRRGLERLSRKNESKPASALDGPFRKLSDQEAERETDPARATLLADMDRALGPGVFTEDGKLSENFVDQALLRFLIGPMSEETFGRFVVLTAGLEARRDEIRARKLGDEENESALKNLNLQFHRDLQSVLSPMEMEEFDARSCLGNILDKVHFETTDLSPAEIRQIALIRARFQDPTAGEWFHDHSLSDQQEAQAAEALRLFLGESRYGQLDRAGNEDFKSLYDLGCSHNLPRDAAVAAFELRQLAAQEVKGIREDSSLSESERQARFTQLQSQAQEGVLKMLGAKACEHYFNHGGTWLTNIGGL